MVDSYCKGCAYLGSLGSGSWCSYSDVVGHTRGCPSGEGCTQKLVGKRLYNPNIFLNDKNLNYEEYEKRIRSLEERKKKEKPVVEKERLSNAERKRRDAKKNRELAQGRQRAVLLEYKKENNLTTRMLADILGLSETTVDKWLTEYSKANWKLLSTIGVQKPEGL